MLTGSKRRKGFSLLEILLAVVLLVVLTAVTLPDLRSAFGRFQLDDTVNDLVALMRYAQSRAVTKGETIRLEFGDELKEYRLTEQGADEGEYRQIGGRIGRVRYLPEEISIDSEHPSIDFFPSGRIDRREISVCHNPREECRVISTQAQRGRIEVLIKKTP